MKKKTVIMILAAVIVFLVPTIYSKVINTALRYETPEESFKKSGPKGSELVNVLEDNGVALVVYKKIDGVVTMEMIFQSQRGWEPLNMEYSYKKSKMTDKGVVYLSIINGKYIVHVSTMIKNVDTSEFTICDNMGSQFMTCSYEFGDDVISVEGLLVSEEKLPDDYKVIIDGLEVPLY